MAAAEPPAAGSLEPWRDSLRALERALRAYARRLDEGEGVGPHAPARAADRAALQEGARALSGAELSGRGDEKGAEGVFVLCGRLAQAQAAFGRAAAAALSPAAAAATESLSRTWQNETGSFAAALKDAQAAAAAAAHLAGRRLAEGDEARALSALEPDRVAAAYLGAPVSAPGAALFAALLVRWRAAGLPAARRLAGDAEDVALGLPPDTPQAAQGAQAARAGMHPLQAMGLTFGFRPGGELPDGPAPGMAVLNATLPQARTAVRYSLAPLVDPEAAALHGPLAPALGGLTGPLVRRLRTIRTEPLATPPAERPPAGFWPPDSGAVGLARTIDGGATYQEMMPEGPLPPGSLEVLGAGPRPRVARLGQLLSEAFEAAPAARLSGSAEALARHSADPGPPLYSRGALEAAVLFRLPEVFAGKPFRRESDFRRALLGGDEPLSRSYLAEAVAGVARAAAEKETARRDAAGDSLKALMFGSRGAARRGGAREALLTALIQQGETIQAVRRAMASAYEELGAARRAEKALDAGGEEGGARSRADLLALARDVVRRGLSPPHLATLSKKVDKLSAVEPVLGFKGYALAHPPLSPEAEGFAARK